MKTYIFEGLVYVPYPTEDGTRLEALETVITIKAKSLTQAQRVFNHYGMESMRASSNGGKNEPRN